MTAARRAGTTAPNERWTDPRPARGDDLLTPDEVADLYRTTTKTLRNWRSLRTGPAHVKVGGLVRYRRADVEAYIT